MSKLNVDNAILVVVDYQEKLFPSMSNKEDLLDKTAKLIKGCRILGVPIIATQQYTKGLGDTIPELKKAMTEPIDDDVPETEFKYVEKKSFSCMDEPDFKDALIRSGREQVIICGIESHICVQQTALDLFEYGSDDEYDEDEYEFDAGHSTDNVVILIDRNNDNEEDDDEYTGAEFEVFLACDCVSSRNENDKGVAIVRMNAEGIEMTTMESILFELTKAAANPAFKRISKVVK
jgi:nicotinamidase-related amidase